MAFFVIYDIFFLVISLSKFTIKQVFIDNWDNFVTDCSDTNIRPVVFNEVNKIINCGNPNFGYAFQMYVQIL